MLTAQVIQVQTAVGDSASGREMRICGAQVIYDRRSGDITLQSPTSSGIWSLKFKVSGHRSPSSLLSNCKLSPPVLFMSAARSHSLIFVPGSVTDTRLRCSNIGRFLGGTTGSDRRTTAHFSLDHDPVPDVPSAERHNKMVNRTLRSHSHLFAIVTPINIGRFERYLARHPNPRFVQSVCRSLRKGFWPWANTNLGGFPNTWEEKQSDRADPARARFLRTQRDEEIILEHFSKAFPTLLQGMFTRHVQYAHLCCA
ncbi:hypothetical protein OBBRIDRAFT_467679 [Obba rivulosa]|uniref:Uncharacterized protein n=1 Tax=Obba rivulosa TaxID=1052685 RepID=A0A8E2B4G7_9APHY|nr:hypothetical protein OBBRIDRAFT_467679 [Obba rivulosa]